MNLSDMNMEESKKRLREKFESAINQHQITSGRYKVKDSDCDNALIDIYTDLYGKYFDETYKSVRTESSVKTDGKKDTLDNTKNQTMKDVQTEKKYPMSFLFKFLFVCICVVVQMYMYLTQENGCIDRNLIFDCFDTWGGYVCFGTSIISVVLALVEYACLDKDKLWKYLIAMILSCDFGALAWKVWVLADLEFYMDSVEQMLGWGIILVVIFCFYFDMKYVDVFDHSNLFKWSFAILNLLTTLCVMGYMCEHIIYPDSLMKEILFLVLSLLAIFVGWIFWFAIYFVMGFMVFLIVACFGFGGDSDKTDHANSR